MLRLCRQDAQQRGPAQVDRHFEVCHRREGQSLFSAFKILDAHLLYKREATVTIRNFMQSN